MKLYYKPGACSLAPHIALREAGLPFELVRVDTKAGRTADGQDFKTINPKGYVPVIGLDDGQVLTECTAILQYIADLAPAAKLAPPNGTFERIRLQEWLGYISTELHKSFAPLFNKQLAEDARRAQIETLSGRFTWVSSQLRPDTWLLGGPFTVADAYLFTVFRWTKFIGVDRTQWPQLVSFFSRAAERPSIVESLRAEGAAL